ncbi:MAG: phosphatidylserine decarboxylase [Acidobacteria bacterium]|nr:phosphatidylserine decarboxylase [Acidobacteriota bacterium]
MHSDRHQYIDRISGRNSEVRESMPALFRLLTGRTTTTLLGWLNYDLPLAGNLTGAREFLDRSGIDSAELLRDSRSFRTLRDIFERQICYWDCRPMPDDQRVVVSPADSRLLVGSLREVNALFLKGKFFDLVELLGLERSRWTELFAEGQFAIFRLTPEKYHYNHTPVAGTVVDYYEVRGEYHACNPTALVSGVTTLSKNTRHVTIIDTDVAGGTGVGLVAMIEIVALMIGGIEQLYSSQHYDHPAPITPGMFLEKGCPKSLYHPGSSTDLVLFEPDRVEFDRDLLDNLLRSDVQSRYSAGLGRPLVETEVRVRTPIARATER